MLSGQGRHRRPRQAPAIVVAAGVTGSALALPLLGATGAHAADAQTWDRVADCESGGAWSSNEGNGYYGGLQLSQDTWESYGGLAYAPSADQASRSQQIAIGEKVLADRGPDAWPNCAPTAGLAKGGEKADVDPGLPAAPTKPADPSDDGKDSKDGKDASKGKGDAKGKDKGDAEDADGSADARDKNHDSDTEGTEDTGADKGDAGADDRDGKGTGKHRKPADGDEADKGGKGEKGGKGDPAGESDSSEQSDPGDPSDPADPSAPEGSTEPSDGSGPADGASGRHRGPGADESAPGEPGEGAGGGRHASRGESRDAGDARGADGTYTVRSGDNLSTIADHHDLDGGWSSLYAGNKKTVGSDPDLILPGQRLALSEKAAAEKAEKAGK
ncbi:transglycosylase family protein [Streptomyces sp. NPDC059063]|uniref:transglycosylase family protein n=1 Tax=unclassified Streptomyces TaxID=2593676 RepID=UPI0036C9067D